MWNRKDPRETFGQKTIHKRLHRKWKDKLWKDKKNPIKKNPSQAQENLKLWKNCWWVGLRPSVSSLYLIFVLRTLDTDHPPTVNFFHERFSKERQQRRFFFFMIWDSFVFSFSLSFPPGSGPLWSDSLRSDSLVTWQPPAHSTLQLVVKCRPEAWRVCGRRRNFMWQSLRSKESDASLPWAFLGMYFSLVNFFWP